MLAIRKVMPSCQLFAVLAVNVFEPVPISTDVELVPLVSFKASAGAVAWHSSVNGGQAAISASGRVSKLAGSVVCGAGGNGDIDIKFPRFLN